MGSFKPRMSILPAAQKQLWPALRAAPRLGFVLYGGTAIALRLGHRRSVDFDFFTDKELDRKALDTAFPFVRKATVLQDERNTLTVTVPSRAGPVKVSFFGGIDFGRFTEPEFTQDNVLQVAGLDDLMATKLKTILQRVESRDYRDIAAMIKAGADLAKGLAIARAMFGTNFQPAASLKTLTYFKGGDLDTLTADERNLLASAAAGVRDLPAVRRLSPQLHAGSVPRVPSRRRAGTAKAKPK